MTKSRTRPAQDAPARIGTGVAADNAVIGFTPDPSPPPRASGGDATASPVALSPDVAHGCVDWFDYKNHPLQRPVR